MDTGVNLVLLLVRDNFEMNKRCIDSIFAQDVHTLLVIIDNSERNDTTKWATDNNIAAYLFRPQIGVSRGWNFGLSTLFKNGAEHVLVPDSDTILPPWHYSELLSYDTPFITGISVDTMEEIQTKPERASPIPHPDYSSFLIRREAWEKIGPFDETLWAWAGDCDHHLRGHRLGIPMLKSPSCKFYHERSSTIRLAPPKERRIMELQADADRETFFEKYGAYPGTPEYAELFK